MATRKPATSRPKSPRPPARGGYLARFQAMVQGLAAHPRVTLLTFHAFPRASSAELKQAEAKLGAPLPAHLRRFYAEEANGLQLRWKIKSGIDFEPRKDRFRTGPFKPNAPMSDYGWATGCVNILQAKVFAGQKTKGTFWSDDTSNDETLTFSKREYGRLDFHRALRMVDGYSISQMMVFALLPGVDPPPLLMGADEGACFTDSRLTSFDAYLELLLAKRGLISARGDCYGEYEGHRKKPLGIPARGWKVRDLPDLDTLEDGS